MRLTRFGNRYLRAALAAACLTPAGCQRLPYIDQSKPVPHDPIAAVAEEDRAVRQAAFFSDLPMQVPDIVPPRTPDNAEAMEPWSMTLEEAIQIGMDNSEVIRVISLGAQGIPVEGFAPTPLNTQAGAALGAGTLATVYDPAIQETQIARALSVFDAQLTSRLFYENRDFLVNNSIQAGFFDPDTNVFALVRQKGAPQGIPTFETALQKRTAVGSVLRIANQIDYTYGNSPIQTFPSTYASRLTLQFSQPLLGGSDQFGPSGLEANRAPVVISRLQADTSVWRFKAEVMAMVRSIEQQYWALAQQQVQYWSRQQAVRLGEAIYEREVEKKRVGTGSEPDVAEAEEQLRQFQLDLVQSTSDLITTERQFRELLGMPPYDGRRIVPVSEPTTARLQPDWESSLAQMISYQPDIVQQQLLVRVAELQLLLARNQLLPALNLDLLYQFNGLGQNLDDAFAVMTGRSVLAIDPIIANQQAAAGVNPSPSFFNNFQTWQVGLTFSMPIGFRGPLAETRQAQYALLRQRAFLQQTVHQTTHALARFFVEVDANYKLLKVAGQLREAAERRLKAQEAFFEAGTINIDRYLDAVNRWSNAVATEARFKTSYNTAIAALEEAKGTLLAYNNIAVAEGPQPKKAYIQAVDQQKAHHQIPIEPDGPVAPRPVVAPPIHDPVTPMLTPGSETPRMSPDFPAPFGTFGPPPQPVGPAVPVGDPAPLASNPGGPVDPAVSRAGAYDSEPVFGSPAGSVPLPPTPPSTPSTTATTPRRLPPLPSRSLPADGPGATLPELPPGEPVRETPPIDLPPLPSGG
ncbi:TolC family protein [Tautonia plasticadhaerens]|uniref:Outer membrane channel protein n=1 Tax=Tautonia plasticadhaerens TaxID=2527974 RepID=A0A518H566_9BACT|nr:TolC family protein [Tautonia plasticadhaerens]QDV35979.1 outer membrane channel protein [Tautonia plasticadhaerens]